MDTSFVSGLGYCILSVKPLRNALDIINGKWKLQIMVAIRTGRQRFRDIERSIPGILSKVLAKELKHPEMHLLTRRTV